MESSRAMKIILSRKGFDSGSGGTPSPIFPDGQMLSLPIPDKQSRIRYQDIRWQEYDLGTIVSDLTGGRIPPSYFAHLDPDLNRESLPRHTEWRPLFGQTGAAQGHLGKNSVQAGDLFLFFGLFRNVIEAGETLQWDRRSRPRHVLWGWLQIEKVVDLSSCDRSEYDWAAYHPHFHWNSDKNNTLYVAQRRLAIPGVTAMGAGVFQRFRERLVLSAPDATKPT